LFITIHLAYRPSQSAIVALGLAHVIDQSRCAEWPGLPITSALSRSNVYNVTGLEQYTHTERHAIDARSVTITT